ncbi:MAG: hypothetical protein GEU80_03270 [Dehalococcoidia bacterium]|nr:hypothetical protein [Dehalococcoidia bacterium]
MSDEKTLTLTVPAVVAEEFDRIALEEGVSVGELLPEMLKAYRVKVAQQRLRRLQQYGARRARELGITEEDVPRLIEEYRREQREQA